MKFHLNENFTQLILKESTKEEYNQLKLYLSRFVEGYRFMPRYKLTKWDGKIDYFKNGFINFGLWSEIKNCCDEYGFPFIIDNKDKFPINKEIKRENILNFCNEFYKDHKDRDGIKEFTPHEHQIDALFKILKYNYGLIEVATAGGKSLIFGSLIFYYLKHINPNAKFLLIVPRMDLVTQFYNDILDYNYGFNKENQNPLPVKIDEIFSDKPRKHHEGEPNVFIGTYQSLVKWPKEWFQQFDVVCVDECLHPDTLITMGDNSKKKISDVKIGDKVYTINKKTKEKEIKEVDYVYKNLSENQQMYELEMINGNIIKITGNHKVLLSDNNWKRVDELNENDDILDFNF